jgi:uncharacterized sulfatase
MAALSRRDFVKCSAAGAALAALGAVPSGCAAASATGGAEGPSRPPNIVWLSAEDLSPTLGCYGDAYATTPNLDRFAKDAVRYDRAFTHAPVCAPARSGIITGMHSAAMGTMWMRCGGVPPVGVKCFPEFLRAAGYYCTNSVKTDYQFGVPPAAWDDCSKQAHFRNRPRKDQPFFAVFNHEVTHESSTRNFKPGQPQQHDPAKAPVPPYYPDTPLVRQNIACYYDRQTQMDAQIQKVLDQLDADGLADDTIVWFWGDHGWGLTRGKRWVYESGTRVPLMIRVPARRRAWAGAGDAACVAPGRVEGDLARFIDFAPTVLSLAGVPIPAYMQGRALLGPQKGPAPEYVYSARDRMDETTDCIRSVRDARFRYIRNFMPYLTRAQHIDYMDQTPILQEMRRLHAAGELKAGPQMQFFEPTKPVHELYDCDADPHNVVNLADDPTYADVLARMSKALLAKMKEIGDVGLIPEADFDAAKGGGACDAPVFTVVEGAGAAGPQKVALSCATAGASIVYQTGADGGWMVYAAPLTVASGAKVQAKACRLGYKDSRQAAFAHGDAGSPPAKPEAAQDWRARYVASDLLDRLLALKAYDGRYGDGVTAFRAALKDPDGPVRYWAVMGLRLAFQDKAPPAEVKAEVAAMASDASPSVPSAVGWALVDWGDADAGLAALIACLKRPSEKGAHLAGEALERLGEKARPVLAEMEAALASDLARYPSAPLKRAVAALKKA